ncbi:MAG: superinfection immunity protein, partial [Bacteroidota bacterium]
MKSLLENHFTGLMITLWIIYIIPILIASYRKCNHINGIALVNILLGTSILGWVGALVWAVSDKKETFKLPKHRIWVYISVIFMVIGTIGSIFIYKNMYNKPHADIENTMPAYSLNAQELWKQYNQELKLADSLYTGKVIEITGNLSKID